MRRSDITACYRMLQARLGLIVARGKSVLDLANARPFEQATIDRAIVWSEEATQFGQLLLARYHESHDDLLPRRLADAFKAGLEAMRATQAALRPWAHVVMTVGDVAERLTALLPD